MEVHLIRHTTPDIAKGICYGKSDIGLATSFENEWRHITGNLPEGITAIYSSPLLRCMRLAEKLKHFYDAPVIQDTRLMEMNFGNWELKYWDDIDQNELHHWMNNFREIRCPGGESYQDVLRRISSFIHELPLQSHKKIVVVTHAGVIKCFDTLINRRDGMELNVGYGGIYVCRVTPATLPAPFQNDTTS